MASAKYAMGCARGESVVFPCTHTLSGTDATPVNITGWTIKWTVKDASGTTVLTKTGAIVNGPNGTYTLTVTHADTLLDPLSYDSDIWRTDSGSETRMGSGPLTVEGDQLYR